jgi:hypothetical protein
MLVFHDTYNCGGGAAVLEYAIGYLGRRHPGNSMFRLLAQRLCETGIVTPTAHANADRPRTVRTSANIESITAAVC